MRVATWNVNSIRVRLPQLLDWIEHCSPDVIALQETKTINEVFPADAFEQLGYSVIANGQKTYNGVALLSRQKMSQCLTDLPGLDDPQRRFVAATIDGLHIVNVYVPNGQSLESEKYDYKLQWLSHLHDYLSNFGADKRVIVTGDFNIAPADIDVYDPVRWQDRVLVSEPERSALQRILDLGFSDLYRQKKPASQRFSWWDYRGRGFERNHGLRIDLILASSALAGKCRSCRIDAKPRANKRPSDHAPVIAEFEM